MARGARKYGYISLMVLLREARRYRCIVQRLMCYPCGGTLALENNGGRGDNGGGDNNVDGGDAILLLLLAVIMIQAFVVVIDIVDDVNNTGKRERFCSINPLIIFLNRVFV